jgi:hypothetical protein
MDDGSDFMVLPPNFSINLIVFLVQVIETDFITYFVTNNSTISTKRQRLDNTQKVTA